MKGIFMQLISTATLTMPTFFLGFDMALYSYTKQILQRGESSVDGTMTNHQASLLRYLNILGCLTSTMMGGNVTDALGRKRTAILCGLLSVLSWSIVAAATDITQILLARSLMGISCGAHIVNVYLCISEYSQTSLRGTLISMVMAAGTAGVLVSFTFGYYFSFNVISYIMLTLSVSYVGLLSFPKKFSIYLISRGQYQEALKSLEFSCGSANTTELTKKMAYICSPLHSNLMKTDVEITKEVSEMLKNHIIINEKTKNIEVNPWQILWSTRSMKRALVIITLSIVLMTFTATIATRSSQLLILNTQSSLSSHICSIILSTAWLFGCGVSAITSNFVGRRVLVMTSSVVSAFCLTATASMLTCPWAPAWASPTLILLFCLSFPLGATNVPFVQLSESFLPELKSAATVCALSGMWLSHIAGMAVFSPAVEFLGLAGIYAMMSITAAVLATLSYMLIKETKDVTVGNFQDIFESENLYNNKKYTSI